MNIEALAPQKTDQFIAYCKKHKTEIDESFLYNEHLKSFQPDEDNPTYIVTDNQENIISAASLIMDAYNRNGKKGRFRIFHSEIEDYHIYSMQLNAILRHTEGIERVFLFVPIVNQSLSQMLILLNFTIERYVFLLVREAIEVPEYRIPKDYTIKAFQRGQDEQVWCEVRNIGFANLKGNETPITPEMVTKMVASEEYIEGGMLILYHKQKPVGVVRGSADDYDGEPIMNIGPLAIIPEYQGQGLGKLLLRASLHFAKEKSYNKTILSVNGENENAKALYIKEGFKQVEAVTCFNYSLHK